ncbi:MAG: methylated-DNA--[protein]-cysteine S-methyltransferase [Phycisphaerales bacterium]
MLLKLKPRDAPPTRAVARASALNRLVILIPCRRIIGSDGSLTGYGGHLWRKQWLLDLERSTKTKEARAQPRLHHPCSLLPSP